MQQLKVKQQKLNGSRPGELCVMATGGGAYKYYDKMKEVLGVEVLREDEMECLIIGGLSLEEEHLLGDVSNSHVKKCRSRFLHHRDPI